MTRRADDGGGAVALLDDAVQLVRRAPWSALLCFYAGSLPFVLGLLVFVVDMRHGTAAGRAGPASLGMALLYLWMKGWHTVFAARLRRVLAGPSEPAAVPWRRIAIQAAVQPWSLFALPVAFVVMVPFVPVYSWFHAVTLCGDAPAAQQQAVRRLGENHVLAGLLLLCGVVVSLNILALLLAAPVLLSTFFGIETPFSRAPMLLFDANLFFAAAACAWLIVAPVAHAAYVVRAYRFDTSTTGADLLREIEALPPVARRVGALVLVLVVLLGAGGGAVLAAGGSAAAPGAGAAPAAGIPAADLERAFRRVIARREFAWRLPPPPARADEENEGMVTRFLHSVTRTIRGWVDATGDFFSPIIRWILEHLDRMAPGTPEEGAAPGWPRRASWILLGVGIVVAGVLWRWWRGREAPVQAQAVAVTPTVVPDVATAGPGDAASDHWLAQARALLERGEARLAARAVHLGTLALLGEAGILTLGRARSDRDYLREMRRRRPDRPEMAALFGDGVQRFERVWYGEHPAGTELVEFLREQCERLRSHARG